MGKCADEKVLRSAEVHGPHGPRRLFPATCPFSAWQAYLKGAHKHPLLLIHMATPFWTLPNPSEHPCCTYRTPFITRPHPRIVRFPLSTLQLSRVADRAPLTGVYRAYLTPANCTHGTAAACTRIPSRTFSSMPLAAS